MNYQPHGKTRKHNATSRIIVGQKEGRKEAHSTRQPPGDTTQALKPAHEWIDCPKDKAAVKVIADRGRVTARQLAKTLKEVLNYVVTEVVDCGGARCNEPCCRACFGEEKAKDDAGHAHKEWAAAKEVIKQWEKENK